MVSIEREYNYAAVFFFAAPQGFNLVRVVFLLDTCIWCDLVSVELKFARTDDATIPCHCLDRNSCANLLYFSSIDVFYRLNILCCFYVSRCIHNIVICPCCSCLAPSIVPFLLLVTSIWTRGRIEFVKKQMYAHTLNRFAIN